MKRYLFLITLLTALTGRVIAQSVTVDATIDSLQILIGEQAKIKLQVSLDTDKRAIFLPILILWCVEWKLLI